MSKRYRDLYIVIEDVGKEMKLFTKDAFEVEYIDDLSFFEREIYPKLLNAVLIDENLKLKNLIKIRRGKLYGDTLKERIKNFFKGVYYVEIEFSTPEDITIDKLKEILIEALKEQEEFIRLTTLIDFDKKYSKELQESFKKVVDELRGAKSFDEVMDILTDGGLDEISTSKLD